MQPLAAIGSLAATVGATLAPCCFPLLGFLPALTGLAGWTAGSIWMTQGSVLVALIGLWIGRHRVGGVVSLALGFIGTGLILLAYHATFDARLVYGGLVLLATAAMGPWVYRIWMRFFKMPILRSVLTCPACGFRQAETMPTEACLYFWNCSKCGARVRPLSGDCCVFCSYGSVPCPPVELKRCTC